MASGLIRQRKQQTVSHQEIRPKEIVILRMHLAFYHQLTPHLTSFTQTPHPLTI